MASPHEVLAAAGRLNSSLAEVMEWIRNWYPAFIEDEEWQECSDRAVAALQEFAQVSTGAGTR